MARISGIDIPREKRVIASLRYIHGVGAKRAEDMQIATKKASCTTPHLCKESASTAH